MWSSLCVPTVNVLDVQVLRAYLQQYFNAEIVGQSGRVKPLPGTRVAVPSSKHKEDYMQGNKAARQKSDAVLMPMQEAFNAFSTSQDDVHPRTFSSNTFRTCKHNCDILLLASLVSYLHILSRRMLPPTLP
eukprot:scaffold257186_cov24-Tisochrysis_lutea.AAC.1